MAIDETAKPNTEGIAFGRMKEALEIMNDVYEGGLRVRAERDKYLPCFGAEDPEDYEQRLKQAVLYNALKRTVGSLIGMVFRKDPVLSDKVPAKIRGEEEGKGGHWENIDNGGTHGRVFLRESATVALLEGHSVLFVDKPPTPEGARSGADTLGMRPYWINVPASRLIRFDWETFAGAPVVTALAWTETVIRKKGRFEQEERMRVREYELGNGSVNFTVWEKSPDSNDWPAIQAGAIKIDRIPIAPIYSNQTGFLTSAPPLLDLALENIGHYQVRSDRRFALHIAGVPVPYTVGMTTQQGQQKVSIRHGFNLPIGGSAGYMEPTGDSLPQMQEELKDIEKRMAALGLAMLERDSRAAETAEARRLDKVSKDSQLAAFASAIQDGAEEALRLHAVWLGEEDGGSIEVNRDFEDQELDAQQIDSLSAMVEKNQLSLDTLWDIMLKHDALPENFDAEIERQKLAQQSQEELDAFAKATAAARNGNRNGAKPEPGPELADA